MLPYSDEQKMIKETVRKLAREKIEPLIEEMERTGQGGDEALKILAENDLLKLSLPEEYGGIGADFTTMAIVIEEMAKVDSSMGMHIFTSAAGLALIVGDFATEDQKKKLFTSCRNGDQLGAFLLTEPGHGSDAANMTTKAVLDGERYVINGLKTMITNGPDAGYFILFARTGPGDKSRGIGCFLFPKSAITGMTAGNPLDKLGFRFSKTSEMFFEDARLPREFLLGNEGDGWNIMATAGGAMRAFGASSIALGNAEGALEYAIGYAKERVTFGRPLVQHQAIQFSIAEMGMQIEAARSLQYTTLQMIDRGDYTPAEYQLLCSATKGFCCDMAMNVTINATQILGAYGVMNEYPMGRRLRDAKVNQIFDGASEIQKMVVGKILSS